MNGEEFATWFQQEFENDIPSERLAKYTKQIRVNNFTLPHILQCSTVPELKQKMNMAFGDAKLVLLKLHSLQFVSFFCCF